MKTAINSSIRVAVDYAAKDNATKVARRMGISLSEAIRMFIFNIIKEDKLPFETHIPNAKTRKAMMKHEAGIYGSRFDNLEDAFKDLGI